MTRSEGPSAPRRGRHVGRWVAAVAALGVGLVPLTALAESDPPDLPPDVSSASLPDVPPDDTDPPPTSEPETTTTTTTAPPAVSVAVGPTEYDFGMQGVNWSSGVETFTVTNSGAPVGVSSISIDEVDLYVEDDHCSGSTLATGANCSFGVSFIPQTGDVYTGVVTVAFDSGDTATVAISGKGLPAASGGPNPFTASNFDIGRVSTNLGAPTGPFSFSLAIVNPFESGPFMTVTLRMNARISPFGCIGCGFSGFAQRLNLVSAGDFTLDTAGCSGVALAPGEGCAATLYFAPTVPGAWELELVLETNRGRFTQTITAEAVAAEDPILPETR